MININLLGDDTAVDHTSKLVVAGYVSSLALCCIVFFSMYASISADVNDLSLKSEELQSQLTMLKTKTKAVRDLEAKRERLKRKITLIGKLKKSKTGPVRVLDDLNTSIPQRVWLRQLTEDRGILNIRGRALNNQDIAMFMKNLSTSDYFENVDLVESRQMYYSKRTGKVSPTPDVESLRTEAFGTDSRATKQSPRGGGATDDRGNMRRNILKRDMNVRARERQGSGAAGGDGSIWGRRSQFGLRGTVETGVGGSARTQAIEERNVKIKEFIVSAKVRYAGKFGSAFERDDKGNIKPVSF